LQQLLEFYNQILYPLSTILNRTSNIMKKISYIVAFATFCLMSFSAHAQEGDQQMLTQGVDSGSANKYALRVLTPLDGNRIIGGRMMLDESSAIDLDFQFNFGSDNEVGIDGKPDVVEGLALTARASYMKYIKNGRVSPYYKAGIDFGVFTDDQSGNDDIGLFGGLGAEFFVIPEFSLFAEAGLSIGLSPFAIDTGSSHVGLAFYF